MTKTYNEALSGASLLLEKAGIDPDAASYVLSTRLQWTRSQLVLHGRDSMPVAVATQFAADTQRLLQNEPAQYIVGRAPFWGRWFNVDPRVLIPRFDTELLIEWILADQLSGSGLDLATGSGAIGLTLALELPQLQMTLSDLSADALTVAQSNATQLNVPNVQFVQSDLLQAVPAKFDFIVSNLPYIDRAEMPVMDTSTKLFEPEMALYADNHGLALFAQLLPQLAQHLQPGGAVYLEFGYHQRAALARMIATMLPAASAEFRRDDAGNDRAVKISF